MYFESVEAFLAMGKHARGDRVAFLKGDDESAVKEADNFEKARYTIWRHRKDLSMATMEE